MVTSEQSVVRLALQSHVTECGHSFVVQQGVHSLAGGDAVHLVRNLTKLRAHASHAHGPAHVQHERGQHHGDHVPRKRLVQQKTNQRQLNHRRHERENNSPEHHGDGPRAPVDDPLQRAGPPVQVEREVQVQHVVKHLQRDSATRGLRHL